MRRLRILIGVLVLVGVLGQAAPAPAQHALQRGIDDLVRQIIASMEQQQKRKLAILDFTKLDGSTDNFGRYLAETLTTSMFLTKRFEVIERRQLDKILAELRMNLSDVIDAQNAKRLGRIYGVDAIASGSVTELAASVEVNARLIETETGRVFAVAKTPFIKDTNMVELMRGGRVPFEVGPGMVLVPAGEFVFGPDGKEQRISLPAFAIDLYEVTNAQYAKVQRHSYPADNANHPVVKVSWHEAKRYCEAVGKRLPTEQEWEKAARGTDGRYYPWGSNWDSSKANAENRLGGTAPVGQFPEGRSPYGAFDMAGNVWEWTASEQGTSKVMRGGAWKNPGPVLRAVVRYMNSPTDRDSDIGFRCAKGAP